METNKLAEKQWYVVTTYALQENKVKDNIALRVLTYNLQDYIFRIVVAEEKVPVLKEDGSPAMKKNKETGEMEPKYTIRNLYPGYVFVEMIMTDETWFVVRNTPGVTGIAGSSGGGQKPTPVGSVEMETVLKRMGMVDSNMYDNYKEGDIVKIIHGAFDGVEGKIISIDKENATVKIDMVFFGKHNVVEVDFTEIVHI